MWSALNFLRKNSETNTIHEFEKIDEYLDGLYKNRVPLLIEYCNQPGQYYAIVTKIDSRKQQIELLDLTPGDAAKKWKKGKQLKIISSPDQGDRINFNCQLIKPKTDENYYLIKYPKGISIFESRRTSRVSIGLANLINVEIQIANNFYCEGILNDILAKHSVYDSLLQDLSVDGMQIKVEGKLDELLKVEDQVHACLTSEEQSQGFITEFVVKWINYDEGNDITLIGGSFKDLDIPTQKSLGLFISKIQAKMYHNFL